MIIEDFGTYWFNLGGVEIHDVQYCHVPPISNGEIESCLHKEGLKHVKKNIWSSAEKYNGCSQIVFFA